MVAKYGSTDNSPSQDYTHLDDQTTRSQVTPGFKSLTVFIFIFCQLTSSPPVLVNVLSSQGENYCFQLHWNAMT